ncbi:bicyclomycin resistance protein [Coniella lustricola]|uniref:Bicyclomycin resistance protein n=1 Tax=Coniella lustricola TaxID=2025994 RepID=A0A2T2ZXE5_9PEZI|nr:bicyclomycin resistance protein [Coniella lustricola]
MQSRQSLRLQANSGAAFVRKLALKIDPSKAPKLNLFGWNVGARKLSYNVSSTAAILPIVDISSSEHIKTLARVYFDKIDPCYGFIDRRHFFERLAARWTRQQQVDEIYDSVLCGVAALGCLFSQRNATAMELHLARSARSCLDNYEMEGPPCLDAITGWTLRTIYLRMTSSPHATWVASCTLMHLVEASGLHPESPSAVLLPSAQWDADLKRRLVGMAYHLNVWTSFDLGLSRVSYQNADLPSLPSPRPGDYTVELLNLVPMSLSLEPCRLKNEADLISTLGGVLARTHTVPPSILGQCNLVLCILRRMHSQNLDVPTNLTDDVLALFKRGLESARTLAIDGSPWQHVANVPFQIICVLLVLDTRSSLAMLPKAMQTLSEIVSVCGTETVNDAYSAACLLILLYQQRRRDDLAILGRVLGADQPDRQFASPVQLQTEDENFIWLGELISDLPGLSRVDFDQFLTADMVEPPFPLPAPGQILTWLYTGTRTNINNLNAVASRCIAKTTLFSTANLKKAMEEKLSMGKAKAIPPPLPDPEEYTVEFDVDESSDPQNWTTFTKLFTSILVCSGTFVTCFNSALLAPAVDTASNHLHVSTEVGNLGTSLFVLGFAFGPTLWAPMSELRGRKWPLTAAMLLGGIFTIACAVANNIQTLLVCRFLTGVCGASQLTVVPGVLADIYNNTYRGVAIQFYAITVFSAPFLAPSIGGFITASHLGWRWTLYLPAILSLANGAVSLFFLRETYAPVLLLEKAVTLRRLTNNWGIHARHSRIEVSPQALLEKYFTRPLRMLVTESVLLCLSIYMSFIYGLVYCLLEAYPVVFEGVHGMTPGWSGLPFLGVFLGVLLALCFILSQHGAYTRKLIENKNVPLPEWRLRPPLVGAPVFAIGIFWFGWTGFTPEIHWAVPTTAGILIGFGTLCVFLPCFNYLVDAYLPLAASAVAANIILRSSIAAGFPLFSKQMFEGMGVQWAGTLLGCLAAVMVPIPFLLRRHGEGLRARSRLLKV